MPFVIVDKETRCKVTHHNSRLSVWRTKRGAHLAMVSIYRMRDKAPAGTLEIMEEAVYRAQVPMKTVKNLQTGAEIEIPADTPSSCDPSTETYWSI